jgi:hypothetical protein
MSNRVSSLFAACALAVGAGATSAQTPSPASKPTTVAPVTVQGAASPKTIEKQAQHFVDLYTAETPKLGLIGRWADPLCVEVVNLTPEQAAMVKGRVEEVAKGLGLRVEKPGCRSNVQIVLTSQPQAFLDNVAKANDLALGFHWRSDLKKVKTVTHPIQAWYETATRANGNTTALASADLKDPDGNRVNPFDVMPLPSSETVDTPWNPGPVGCAGSLITDCTRTIFKNVLVVIDSRAAEGKTLGTLADYVAMMALSQAKSLDGCAALPSVMDLMAKASCPGRDPPNGLTDTDIAFLTGLYFSDPETKGAQQQVEIAARMTRLLIKASATARESK